MSTWTDELKETVVNEYVKAEPTPENSMELVKSLAEEYEQSPNGVRMILQKAGVYVRKSPDATKAATTKSGGGGGRGSKQVALARLRKALEASGASVDDDIIDKMTGKAALAFAAAIEKIAGVEPEEE